MDDSKLQYFAQERPAVTTAVTIFSPDEGVPVMLRQLFICNTSGSNRTYRLYLDNDGTTYDESTAFAWDAVVEAGTTEIVDLDVPMRDSAGNIAVRSDLSRGLTFTLYGEK